MLKLYQKTVLWGRPTFQSPLFLIQEHQDSHVVCTIIAGTFYVTSLVDVAIVIEDRF